MLPQSHLIQTPAGHRYMFIGTRDYVSELIMRNGVCEPEVSALALAIVNGGLPGRILDCGANLGAFTIPVALDMTVGNQIIAFEPQRIVYYQLCGNVILNALDSVVALNVALGATETSVDIAMPDYARDTNIGQFSLDPMVREEIKDHITEGAVETVSVVTLDSMALDDVRLIKLDVEGFELDVLLGAGATLVRNGYPPILFESWTQFPWWAERQRALWAHLESLGYKIREICYNNYIAEYK